MPIPNANFVNSKLAPNERWLKLYRKIHNFYLKDEFIHKDDYLLTLQQLNARMSTIEANTAAAIAANAAAINAAIVGHTHPSPQAPAGSLTTGPGTPLGSFGAPTPPTTPIVEHKFTFMEQEDAVLMATGPAVAPIGDGTSVQALAATRTATTQVGV